MDKPKEITIKEPKLTIKQKKWIKEYLKTGNASKAAFKVYDCKNMVSAGAIGYENLNKLQNPVKLLMEQHGISLGSLIVKLGEGLEAKKMHGSGDSFVEVEDFPTRHKYMETAAKWLQVEPKESINTAIQVNIHPDFIKKYDI